MRAATRLAYALATAMLLATAAHAQALYPAKPIKIVVPFLAGGSIDLLIRMLGQYMPVTQEQPFVVENKAGAGGTIGADFVAKSAADGYTLLFTAQGPVTTSPFLMKQMPYDAQTAFAAISIAAEAPNVLIVHEGTPARTVAQLVAYAKASPGKVTYSTPGLGTTAHVTGMLLDQQAGISLVHVLYKGFPPALTDVKAGRVGVMIADTINVLPHLRSKELLPLAVAATTRSSMLPDVPTFAESGYPGIVAGPWFALLAPAGTPMPIRKRLADEIRTALKAPALAQKLKEFGAEPRGFGPEDSEAYLKAEYQRFGAAIRSAGVVPQ